MSKHLLRKSNGHLLRNSNGHLVYRNPQWRNWTSSTTAKEYKEVEELDYTRANVNLSPADLYASVYSSILDGMFTTDNGTVSQLAAVGGAFDRPYPPRVTLWAASRIISFTRPGPSVTAGRIYSTSGGRGGLYDAVPSGSTLIAASARTPSSNYIDFTSGELGTINSAASGATLYFCLAVAPPATFDATLTQQEYKNESGSTQTIYDFEIAAGDTLYWKTGSMSFPSQPLPSTGQLQLYY